MNNREAGKRLDQIGIFRSVKNRMFFSQPPRTDSRRSGKYLSDPALVHENAAEKCRARRGGAGAARRGAGSVAEIRMEMLRSNRPRTGQNDVDAAPTIETNARSASERLA